MSSQRERIELVTLPPQHIEPCATQLQTASALSHTPPCATPVQTASALSHTSQCATTVQNASATRPEPPPRSFKSKKITDYGYQTKNIAKSMANSSVENALENVPTPGHNNTKTSAVILSNNDMTSAPKGFNHLSQLKGERVVGPVGTPSPQATTIFSLWY